MIKKIIVLVFTFFIFSCTHTSVTTNWKEIDFTQTYKHLMIVAVSDSQQTRQIYEKHFAAELKKRNIIATPSYMLINSKQTVNRETVIKALQGTDIDAVLVTYLISADAETRHHDSPLHVDYSAGIVNNRISATTISNRGQSRDEEIIGLKNDLYDRETRKLVWTVQTKSVGPESIDEVVTDVTALLINQLISDELIK